jgi:hypothetical protein
MNRGEKERKKEMKRKRERRFQLTKAKLFGFGQFPRKALEIDCQNAHGSDETDDGAADCGRVGFLIAPKKLWHIHTRDKVGSGRWDLYKRCQVALAMQLLNHRGDCDEKEREYNMTDCIT